MKALILTLLLLTAFYCEAQKPGILDYTYGDNGSATVTFTDTFGVQCLAIQKDNKIITGSYDFRTNLGNTNILTRRNNNGSPDTSFGAGGIVYTDVSDLRKNFITTYGWHCIAVAEDRKIVVAGVIRWWNPNYPRGNDNIGDEDIVVARFLPNGRLDKSFGKNGKVVTNLGYLEDVRSIVLQRDGKILVAGSEIRDIYSNTLGMMIVRYNADGTLDKNFGEQKGYTLFNRTYGDYGSHVQLQADGKIIVGGTHAGNESFIFVRFLQNGLVDNSYGVNGYVETDFDANGGTEMADMVLDSKGRIVATGNIGTSEGTVVSRYLPNGNLDSTFDKDGKQQLNFDNFPYLTNNKILIQPDDKLVISGYTLRKGARYSKQALIGLKENGSLDNSFGEDRGRTITDLHTYGEIYPAAVSQSDGKILVLNTKPDEFPYDPVATLYLTRFNGYKNEVESFGEKKITNITTVTPATTIYPNPATHFIIVNGLTADKEATLSIVDNEGKILAVYTVVNASQYKFDVSKLAAGVYYLQITISGKMVVWKFVKE